MPVNEGSVGEDKVVSPWKRYNTIYFCSKTLDYYCYPKM